MMRSEMDPTVARMVGVWARRPTDLGAHLCLSDLLAEAGDHDHARLIRYQVALAGGDPGSSFLGDPEAGGLEATVRRGAWHLVEAAGVRFVVRSFLFLTIRGTPAADLLYRRLRLARSDIEHLRLDELGTYREGGLGSDPAVADALRECGCGDLVDWLPRAFGRERRAGAATSARSYLRFDRPPLRPGQGD